MNKDKHLPSSTIGLYAVFLIFLPLVISVFVWFRTLNATTEVYSRIVSTLRNDIVLFIVEFVLGVAVGTFMGLRCFLPNSLSPKRQFPTFTRLLEFILCATCIFLVRDITYTERCITLNDSARRSLTPFGFAFSLTLPLGFALGAIGFLRKIKEAIQKL